jgi:hypothetical protein
MKMKKMREMKCHRETKGDGKSQGNCNNNAGCSLCPVCFMFTFQAQYEWLSKHFSFERNYHPVNTTYISSYVPAVWKPPNS